MVLISNILTLLVTAASGYAVYFSAQSIPKLQKYEQTAEKAAEWSSTAKKQLWDTRYTVGAGFIFVRCGRALPEFICTACRVADTPQTVPLLTLQRPELRALHL